MAAGEYPSAFYQTAVPIWLSSAITAVAIALISVWWILRQLGLPKIRARLHDGWWVLEVFMSMTVFGALIYSGFSFMVCSIMMTLVVFFRHRCLCGSPMDGYAPVEAADGGREKEAGKDGKPGEATPLVAGAAKPRSDEDTRFYWIDNARYWLETCVIMKHTMVYVGTLYNWNTWWQPGLASFFESFMMPMFCACSGFLSKGTPHAERCLRVVFRAWIPFVIVNQFYQWFDTGFSGLWVGYANLQNCLEVSWFLACWIQWRLILPYVCSLPPFPAICTAYVLSWFSGYWFTAEPTFHQDEVLGFFPFVVTGYMLQVNEIKRLDQAWIRWTSMVLFTAMFVFMMIFAKLTYIDGNIDEYHTYHFNIYNYYWMVREYNRTYYYAYTYANDDPGYWGFWTVRAFGQIVSWAFGMPFFGLVPHTKTIYSEWGCNTIYPYCLQVFYLKLLANILRLFTGGSIIPVHEVYSIPVWMMNFVSIPFINAAMASRFTRKWTCFVFNPTWAMKVLGFSDPDKYIEDEVGAPTLATHAVSFTGLFLVTSLILYMGGGFGCIMNSHDCA
jgi:hypothetical protein